MRYPLFFILPVYILGIIFGTVFNSFLHLCLASAIALILYLFFKHKGKKALAFLALAIFFTAAASYSASVLIPSNHISRAITLCEKEVPCLVRGFVYGNYTKRGGKLNYSFKVEAIQRGPTNINAQGDVFIRVIDDGELPVGMPLLVKGRLVRINDPRRRKFSNVSYRYLMFADYVYAQSNAHPKTGPRLYRLVSYIKSGIKKIFNGRVSKISSAVLQAMVLGDKADIPKCVYDAMIKTGTIHILVVSGFNTGLVAFIILLSLKILCVNRRLRALISFITLFLYCLIAGCSTPVIRAAIMTMFFLFSFLVKREAGGRQALCLSAFFILVFKANQLYDIGFQLSFISVASLVFLYPKMKGPVLSGFWRHRLFSVAIDSFKVSLSAWLGTAAVIAFYFRTFSPITVIANIFIVPLAALISLLGFGLIIMEIFMPFLAGHFALSIEPAVSLLLKLNAFFLKIPFACLRF